MNVEKIIHELTENGFIFRISDGDLKIRNQLGKRLSIEQKKILKDKKPEIISFLTKEKPTGREKQKSFFSLISEDEKKNYINRKNIENIYPASLLQKGMLFCSEANHELPFYFEVYHKFVFDKFLENHFYEAINKIVHKHPILRTSFERSKLDGDLLQVISKKVEPIVFITDISNFNKKKQEKLINQWLLSEPKKPFTLNSSLFYRITIHILNEKCFYFGLAFHHAILDGLSVDLLGRELLQAYKHLLMGGDYNLELLRSTYDEFIALERSILEDNQAKKYWLKELINFDKRSIISKTDGVGRKGKRKIFSFDVSNDVLKRLNTLALNENVSLDILFLSIHLKILSMLFSQSDVISGVVFNGRVESDDGNNVLGLFLNTLPFRINLHGLSWRELIKKIQFKKNQIYPHRRYPLAEIQKNLNCFNIVEVLFNYTKLNTKPEINKVDPFKTDKGVDYGRTEFLLTLNVNVDLKLDKAFCSLEVCEDIFDEAILKNILNYYKKTIIDLIENTDSLPSNTNILTDQELQKLLYDWNNTAAEYPKNNSISGLFEETVKSFPNCLAVICNNEQMTYDQLNSRANQLAQYIIEKSCKWKKAKKISDADILIGVYVSSGINLIITLLGILKAGAAYVALDVSEPIERLKYKLNDSRANFVITENLFYNRLKHVSAKNTFLARVDSGEDKISQYSCENINRIVEQNNLAYVVYTSGSTGQPKGICVEHKSVINVIADFKRRMRVSAKDRLLSFTSLSFDIFGLEYLLPLLSGASVCLVTNDDRLDLDKIKNHIQLFNPTLIQATPSQWSLLSQAIEKQKNLTVISGGEALPEKLASRLLEITPNVWNVYGPAETTIWSSAKKLIKQKELSIGKPISNTKFYVLDSELQIVPIGVSGELFIAGDGLARGYLYNQDLTEEKFLENPYVLKEEIKKGECLKIYKTGDLVKWLGDGDLKYIGRNDDQVKIRGHRVELGEIESKILMHPLIKQCSVILNNENGIQSVCAYYTSKGEIDGEELRAFILNHLPEYMAPDCFIKLINIPLNSSGKVDRLLLPKVSIQDGNRGSLNFVAPRNETESKLCDIWKKVLGLDNVGVFDDFFRLGGHSLKVSQVVAMIRMIFKIDCPISIAFDKKTISDLAEFIVSKKKLLNEQVDSIPIIHQKENIPLTFSQLRMWFLYKYQEGDFGNYNIPCAIRLVGNLNIQTLERAINYLICRHESLRTFFIENDIQEVFQKIEPYSDNLNIKIHPINVDNIREKLLAESLMPFDLSRDRLFKVNLFVTSVKNESILFINLHHIISDGWSLRILLRDLVSAYNSFNKNLTIDLPKLEVQYSDYAIWQRGEQNLKKWSEQIEYWKNKLKGFENIRFPTDNSRPPIQTYNGKHKLLLLEKDLVSQIQSFSEENFCTLFMVLLSALYILLERYCGQDDLVVGTPIANRQFNQLADVSGLFVNTLAIRSKLPNQSVLELLKTVRTNCLEAYQHQTVPFEKIVEELRVERDQSRSPIFQVMLVLQNAMDDVDLNLDGLDASSFDFEYGISKLDLTFFFEKAANGVICSIEYNADLFNEDTIALLSVHYLNILKDIVQNPYRSIADVNMLSEDEKTKVLFDWNDTRKEYPKDKTLHELFEDQVNKTPENIAVVFEGKSLTYTQLNERVNFYANYLREEYKKKYKKGFKPDSLIGLYFDRSFEMIISLLAILKAGGAYVPLDPDSPLDRVNFLIKQARIDFVLTSTDLKKRFSNKDVFLVDVNFCTTSKNAQDNLPLISGPNNLAYVIYTSGSTGQPKGVMIEHRSVVNRLIWMQQEYDFGIKDHVLQKTPYTFDVSVWELLLPLISGARQVIAKPNGHKDPNYISGLILDQNITKIHFVPSMLDAFLETVPHGRLESINKVLKCIFCSGEGLKASLALKCKGFLNNVSLHNLYGPTEAAIDVSYHEYFTNENYPIVLIGKPIQNVSLYVLDKNMLPLPNGVFGELYIGGDALARGYINLPDITKERFLPNPFVSEAEKKDGYNERLYKTGDVVRWRSNGELEFLGRNDNQMKVRGIRVELAEIEINISKLLNLKNVVISKELSGENEIICYYENVGSIIDSKILKNNLRKYLPEYLIPNYWQQIDALPLNSSGKVDRAVLQRLFFRKEKNHLESKLKLTEIQKKVLTVWQELLQRSDIGLHDNFFDVGGHSLKLIQLKSRLEKAVNLKEFSLTDLFKYPTIQSFVDYILGISQKNKDSNVEQNFLSDKEGVAVIGFSGAFSGAESVEKYWKKILDGEECISYLSKDECRELGVSNSILGDEDYISSQGFLNNLDKFDSDFWGLSPRDAELMDPQIRKFLECCWAALEESGYINVRKQIKIGVFAGCGLSEYAFEHVILNPKMKHKVNTWDLNIISGNSALATRVSYSMGLTGPSLNINTACSTSLVSIIEACEKLINGTCEIALAGGVTLPLPKNFGYIYQEGMIFSKDGHCKVFSDDATGTVPGAGVGVIVLKRYSAAKRDNDNILGIIRGYGINNDGDRKVGFTAPSVIGQSECILAAQQIAGISPDDIDYIECHGTGTKMGDPIEVAALREVFNNYKNKENKCILGSVKANIGHTDAAAGVAGVIKVCKMLETKWIPPQINYTSPNKELNLTESPFEILTKKKKWDKKTSTRKAGISSFGIGGTNSHIIIEEFRHSKDERSLLEEDFYVLPISAKSNQSLIEYRRVLLNYLNSSEEKRMVDIAYTLQERREHFNYRQYILCKDKNEAVSQLRNDKLSTSHIYKEKLGDTPSVIFMFSGQGVQYANMGKKLYDTDNIFKALLDQCIDYISEIKNIDFKKTFFSNSADREKINETEYAQPALFALSYSLAKRLEMFGIFPACYIGHSIGEYVAATLSGVFSLKDALRIVVERAVLMQQAPRGAMLSVNYDFRKIEKLLFNSLEVSVINADKYCVVSGEKKDVAKFIKILTEKKIKHSQLHTSHAFHSKMMSSTVEKFQNFLNKFVLEEPKSLFISCVSGEFISKKNAVDPKYWANQIRMPVHFSNGIKAVDKHYPNAIYLEVGVGKVLSNFVSAHVGVINQTLQSISMIPSVKDYDENLEERLLYKVISELWSKGFFVEWNKLRRNEKPKVVSLPTYKFEQKKCWIDVDSIDISYEEEKATVAELHDKMLSNDKKLLIEHESTSLEEKIAGVFVEVLGVGKFSKYTSFFDLGGHSLNATQIISRIKSLFNIDCNLEVIFNHQSVEELAKVIANLQKKDNKINICKADRSQRIPLSFAQERLWVLDKYQGGESANYSVSFARKLTGNLNVLALERSLNKIIHRYEILRTNFIQNEKGEVCQIIHPFDEISKIKIIPEILSKDVLKERLSKEASVPFDLSKDSLIRVRLFKLLKTEVFVLFINQHHIICDGWSINLFLKEWACLYNSLTKNNNVSLPQLDVQYADFSVWQRNYFYDRLLKKQLDYWNKKLKGFKTLNLPTDYLRPAVMSHEGEFVEFQIDKDTIANLQNLSSKYNATLFMLLLSGFFILLSRYSNQDDIVIGTPVANRHFAELEKTLGVFVNTLVIRENLDGKTIKALISDVRQSCFDAFGNQDLPFEMLVDELGYKRDQSRSPIFQVMFNYVSDDDEASAAADFENIIIEPYEFSKKISKFDLTLYISEKKCLIKGAFNYNTNLFLSKSIAKMIDNYKMILRQMGEDDSVSLSKLSTLTKSDFDQMISSNSIDTIGCLTDRPLNKIFEEQVLKYPERIAIESSGEKLTYLKLNEISNQFARKIRLTFNKLDVKDNKCVGIYLSRNIKLAVAMVAALKAGAPFVFFDLNEPKAKQAAKFKSLNSHILLTTNDLMEDAKKIFGSDLFMLELDLYCNETSGELKNNLDVNLSPGDVVSVIFHDFVSDNMPKSFPLSHLSLAGSVSRLMSCLDVHHSVKILSLTTHASEMFCLECFLALLTGSSFYLYDANFSRFDLLSEKFRCIQPDIVYATPSQWSSLASILPENKNMLVISGGESLSKKCAERLGSKAKRIWNIYGSIETSLCIAAHEIDQNTNFFLGKPFGDFRFYVLGKHLQPVVSGGVGELYISSPLLKTIPKSSLSNYIINPFSESKENRHKILYKTGDFVRWHNDGNFEFVGRKESFVQINGFAFFVEEVEHRLLAHQGIEQCVVFPDFSQNKKDISLVAYLKKDGNIKIEDLQKDLIVSMPSYMLPKKIVEIDGLPLLWNGKLDREHVSKYIKLISRKKNIALQNNDTENVLIGIWKDVLGVDDIESDDNFYDLGGNSLTVVRLQSVINKTFETNLKVVDILSYPTVRHVANIIDNRTHKTQDDLQTLVCKDIINARRSIDYLLKTAKVNRSSLAEKGILLTGATGFLGVYLLDSLITNTKCPIFCLIRGGSNSDIRAKMADALVKAGKASLIDHARIKLIKGDLSLDNFGLSKKDLTLIINEADIIYHNAAFVHHVYDYKALSEVNVKSINTLLTFSANGNHPKSIHYISALSAARVGRDFDVLKKTEENQFPSYLSGYSLSKLVAENILRYAVSKGFPVTIYRPSNITGDSITGYSNYEQNHSLLVLKGCIQMGVVPDAEMFIEMVPVDILAKGIIKLSQNKDVVGEIFNLNNPVKISLQKYVQELKKYGFRIDIIPSEKWKEDYVAKTNENNAMYPLKEFYLTDIHVEDKFDDSESIATQERLWSLGVNYPQSYEKLIGVYTNYLLRCGFLKK